MVHFIRKVRELVPKMIVGQPTYGYPEVSDYYGRMTNFVGINFDKIIWTNIGRRLRHYFNNTKANFATAFLGLIFVLQIIGALRIIP